MPLANLAAAPAIGVVVYPGESVAQRRRCPPTTSVLLLAGGRALHSYHNNEPKQVGGDEFYASLLQGGAEVASALATDLGNGSYALEYERVEMPSAPAGKSAAAIVLRVVLQYTCGHGHLDPPAKEGWPTSGALNLPLRVRRAADVLPLPDLVPPPAAQPSNGDGLIDLSRFDAVVAIGDSTMRQFRPTNADRMRVRIEFHQLSFLLDASSARRCGERARMARRVLGGAASPARQLVLYGGGTWDVMSEYGGGSETTHLPLPEYEAAFATCLRGVRAAFPNATLVLKSLQALHPHRVDCQTATSQLLVNAQNARNRTSTCHVRTKYMSASRTSRLFLSQERVAASLGVRTLGRLYSLTYRHAHQTVRGDGRHFTPQFNDFLWGRTFANVELCSERHRPARFHASRAAGGRRGQGVGAGARDAPEGVGCAVSLVEKHSKTRCEAGGNFGCRVRDDGDREVWARSCRGMFRCEGEADDVACGYPPGAGSYTCRCGQPNSTTANSCADPRRWAGKLSWNLVVSR